jgi:hypothetical protein
MKVQKVPVSQRAIIARINRKLKSEGEALKTLRSQRDWTTLGSFYTVDLNRNCVLDRHIKLEDYARECEALRPYEVLAE